jgi:iron complex outermembrane receptor protein
VPEGIAFYGLGGGLGVRYNSSSFPDLDNAAKNKRAIYLDAALSFDLGKQKKEFSGVTASLSVNNVFDKRNRICSDGYCYFGEGRTVLGSLKYKW